MLPTLKPAGEGLRTQLFHIIFESDTKLAKSFDIALIVIILISVGVIMADSVPLWHVRYGDWFRRIEWGFTILFTLELAVRIYCLDRPSQYLKSFYGIVDILAVMPTWLMLFIPGAHSLVMIRVLRVLRVFRVLRLMQFVGEGRMLVEALKKSSHQILLFIFTVIMLVTIFGTIIYMIEPREAGFTSIPRAIYWGVVTLTTVGYGDIAPVTALGQFISVIVMLLGYSIIAIPTGVFSAEVIRSIRADRYSEEACPGCGHDRHEKGAKYCLLCGIWLDEDTPDPNLPKEEPEDSEISEEESKKTKKEQEKGRPASKDADDTSSSSSDSPISSGPGV